MTPTSFQYQEPLADEARRLRVLRSYGLLDTDAEDVFDRITRLASRLFRMPIVLIALVDAERQWFKSCVGFGPGETPREIAICAQTIRGHEVLVVPDARFDPRFADLPMIVGSPHLRFYAGAPLYVPEGVNIGTLCVLDIQPHQFSDEDKQQLTELAEMVVEEMVQRRDGRYFRSVVENAQDVVTILDTSAIIQYQSPSIKPLLGYASQELQGKSAFEYVHPDDVATVYTTFKALLSQSRTPDSIRFRLRHSDGSWRWVECSGTNLLDDPQVEGLVFTSRDVSARRQVEEQLKASENRFQTAFQYSAIGMGLLSLGGQWLQINRALCELSGYQEGELLGEHVNMLSYWGDWKIEMPHLVPLIEGKVESCEIEAELRHKDGHKICALVGISVVRGDAVESDAVVDEAVTPIVPRGEVLFGPGAQYLVAQIQDISQRKQVEQELRASEAHQNAIIQSSLDAILTIDGASQITEWNPAAESIFGYSREEALGGYLPDLIMPPELHQAHLQGVQRFIEEGTARILNQRLELPALRKDGSAMTMELVITNVDLGERPLFTGFARDISERKRQEERLRLLESVAIHAQEAILITDAILDKGGPHILYVNDAFTRMTGYALADVLGKNPRLLQGPQTSEATRFLIRSALEQRQPCVTELVNYRKDGTPFWTELSIVPVADASGNYLRWVALQRDITARRTQENAVRIAHEEADRANQAKSEFLSRMSHELRTPLNAILGFGQLLETAELGPADAQSVQQILQGGRHLLDLINEVLDIARIESGQLTVTPESVNLGHIVNETLGMVRPLADRRNIKLEVVSASESAIHVQADKQRLRQVLINLLSNAVKYNVEGGRISLALLLKAEQLKTAGTNEPANEIPTCVRLSVSDTGPGIPVEKQTLIFQPFERLGAESSEIEGTGIGLALSRRLVESMNGDMGFLSEVGKGSTFWFELPLSPDEFSTDSPEPFPTPKEVQWEALSKPETLVKLVLYIEDNALNVRLVKGILAQMPSVRLLTANDGEMGLKLAKQHHPDTILLDLNLPGLGGEQILEKLRADASTAHIPVIIVSADATPRQMRNLRQVGADAYLSKPLDIREFSHTLAAMLDEEQTAPASGNEIG